MKIIYSLLFCLYSALPLRAFSDTIPPSTVTSTNPIQYSDSRPSAKYSLYALDWGVVLKHGDGPFGYDVLGSRDVAVYRDGGTYYMTYDGAGPTGWLANMATSTDLNNWSKKGPLLGLGYPGTSDSASASYGNIIFDGSNWHMFYLSTINASTKPNYVPIPAYMTAKAIATSPAGPWIKQYDVIPVTTAPNTFYNMSAAPGNVFPDNAGGYYMMISAANESNARTIGVAHTTNLNSTWTMRSTPIVPVSEQIENGSIYYQDMDKTWFMFVNHVGIDPAIGEYTDAVWMYWTKDFNSWSSDNKAVVIDSSNARWSPKIIGLPSVVKVSNKLAIFYDGQAIQPPAGSDWTAYHMKRDIGMAWLSLPIITP